MVVDAIIQTQKLRQSKISTLRHINMTIG